MKWMLVYMVLALALFSHNPMAHAFDLCKQGGRDIDYVPRDGVAYGQATMITIPDPVHVPVTIDMVKRYGLDTSGAGLEMDSFVGMMDVYKDGRILYEGIDISGDIKESCKEKTNGTSEFENIITNQSQNGDRANAR